MDFMGIFSTQEDTRMRHFLVNRNALLTYAISGCDHECKKCVFNENRMDLQAFDLGLHSVCLVHQHTNDPDIKKSSVKVLLELSGK